jgi:hypothetical protein
MLLRSHPSEFAENWAIPFVNKPSTPMMADRKAELFRMQAQYQETARHFHCPPVRWGACRLHALTVG